MKPPSDETIQITLNGEPHPITSGCSVEELIIDATGSLSGRAVVIDDEVIPRSQWTQRQVEAGQRVELISAVPGG